MHVELLKLQDVFFFFFFCFTKNLDARSFIYFIVLSSVCRKEDSNFKILDQRYIDLTIRASNLDHNLEFKFSHLMALTVIPLFLTRTSPKKILKRSPNIRLFRTKNA